MHKNPTKLICVPFAGAGASFYHGWAQTGFTDMSLAPVQLPGRERLIAQEPYVDLHKAADDLAATALETLGEERAIVFGHCFLGSVLAYEITCRINEQRPQSVAELVVSASRIPSISRPTDVENMNDDQFLAFVKSTTGFTHEAMDIPEMRELLLPALRADFIMDETYNARPRPALQIPITAIAADQDNMVTREEVLGWEAYTDAAFEIQDVSGGHMYLAQDAQPVFDVLRGCLTRNESASHAA
ncbi:MAG: thioesterase domain-containing protein [Pseudoruegeria sp.]